MAQRTPRERLPRKGSLQEKEMSFSHLLEEAEAGTDKQENMKVR